MVQYFTPADSQKALANAATLDEVANGNVGQTVISPDGREYPTLAEAMNRIQQITNDADATAQQKLAALQALYNSANATTQAEISNLQQAIQTAAAAGAGANGWTALVVQDASGKNQQQINYDLAKAENIKLAAPSLPSAPAIVRSVQQEIVDGAFNVARMGAKGHDTFDSTSAFLKAQEEALYLGAKSLFVPANTKFYNISSSLLNIQNGLSGGISLIGEGINLSKLRWVGGAGRMINAFSNWQYGFEMRGFTITSLATTAAEIVENSCGIHIEKNQSSGRMSDILIRGFDTNIDIGVHAQFMTCENIYSREGHILLNAYGQNSDKNVWSNCVFYSPTKIGTIISSPRNTFTDCWWGAGPGWTNTDYIDVLVGYQDVRAEDVGKSTSLTATNQGHHAQHSSLVRPRFERNGSTYTNPYIVFKDINPRTPQTELSGFVIENPIFPNGGTNCAIKVQDVRRGLHITRPFKERTIPLLIEDAIAADGSIQYISVTGYDGDVVGSGQRSYLTSGDTAAKFNSSLKSNMMPTATIQANSSEYDSTNQMLKLNNTVTTSSGLMYATRPSSVAKDAKFYLKASSKSLGRVSIQIKNGGTTLFFMRNIPVAMLAAGVSIVVPETVSQPITIICSIPRAENGDITFSEFCYYS